MSSYQVADRQGRWKAIAGVAAVHVALGAVILSGLNVRFVSQAVERMSTFDVLVPEPPPPPPPPPPPKEQPKQEKASEGAPEKKPSPSPVVVPEPKILVPTTNPIVAANVAGTGNAREAGAGGAGTGNGNGGTGNGTGTGSGDGRGFTPAQRVSKIPDREYRRFVDLTGMSRGSVGVTVKVGIDGSTSDCRIARSSGNRAADSLMCQLTVSYVRFRPARDPQGRPVASDVTWMPNWYR